MRYPTTAPTLVSLGDHAEVCGVALPWPVEPATCSLSLAPAPLARSDYAAPDLSCFQPGHYPVAGTPATAVMSGVAKIFVLSQACPSNLLTIEVHTVQRTGQITDGDIGPLVGTAVTTTSTCGVAVADDRCGTLYECPYTYTGVPTETEIVVLTKGSQWTPFYEYTYIPGAAVVAGGYGHDVTAFASADFPQALGGTTSPGNGVIVGEVRDCDDVLLSGAVVGTSASSTTSTYFNPSVTSTTASGKWAAADPGALSTLDIGLYVALDLPPGQASVAAIGLLDGKVTTAGYYDNAYVYAASITAVTFRGLRPFQVAP
jgi:hypothetical protein